jgi:hypothetical protein
MASLVGQMPFTAFHLVGNVTFAFILSPATYKFLIKKKRKNLSAQTGTVPIVNILNPKII